MHNALQTGNELSRLNEQLLDTFILKIQVFLRQINHIWHGPKQTCFWKNGRPETRLQRFRPQSCLLADLVCGQNLGERVVGRLLADACLKPMFQPETSRPE